MKVLYTPDPSSNGRRGMVGGDGARVVDGPYTNKLNSPQARPGAQSVPKRPRACSWRNATLGANWHRKTRSQATSRHLRGLLARASITPWRFKSSHPHSPSADPVPESKQDDARVHVTVARKKYCVAPAVSEILESQRRNQPHSLTYKVSRAVSSPTALRVHSAHAACIDATLP
jgi:hypothetical protein